MLQNIQTNIRVPLFDTMMKAIFDRNFSAARADGNDGVRSRSTQTSTMQQWPDSTFDRPRSSLSVSHSKTFREETS